MSTDNTDRQPNGRPQSTIARNFSASLNDAFAGGENDPLAGLAKSVEQKKQALSSQSAELEALEQRLRETEQRLKERHSRAASPSGRASGGTNSPHRRQPLDKAFNGQENDRTNQAPTTNLPATQAPASGAVSASTMSHWRPDPRDEYTEGRGNERDISAEQLSGQGSRYSK